MPDQNRRNLLKLGLVLGGAAVIGVGAIELASLLSNSKPNDGRTTTTISSVSPSSTTTSTQPNIPLVVRDLNQLIQPFSNDLTRFGNGQILDSEMKAGNPTYNGLIQDAEALRDALRKYKPQNTESLGQQKRIDQIALAGLNIYSWTSRMLEDDLTVASGYMPKIKSSIQHNLDAIQHPAGELARQLQEELYPDQSYSENTGKTLTDIKNEQLISPRNRFTLQYLRNSSSGSSLKQLIEDYNPQADATTDYKTVTEEQLALIGLNILLHNTDDSNKEYVRTSLENGIKRNSSLGQIASRGMTLIDERIVALQGGYFQSIDSAYGELPSNHIELTDYDFALGLINKPSFQKIFKDIPTVSSVNNWQTVSCDSFYNIASRAGRDCYQIWLTPPSTAAAAGIKYNGKYFWLGIGRTVPGSLYDISGRTGLSYNAERKHAFWIVAKPLFGTMNTIPVLAYNPEKGIVLGP